MRRLNIRLDDDTAKTLDDLMECWEIPGKPTEAIIKALRLAVRDNTPDRVVDALQDVGIKLDELLELARSVPESSNGSDPASIPGVSKGTTGEQAPNCSCLHCGARFAGPRHATVCPACRGANHQNLPANCEACHEGLAI